MPHGPSPSLDLLRLNHHTASLPGIQVLGDLIVQLVPPVDEPTPSQKGSEVDLMPHTRSNAVMKLAVVRSLRAQAHTVLPIQALSGSPSEALLTWLMKKETELMSETNTSHNAHTQWANFCAKVIVRTGTAGCSSSLPLLRMFWGTSATSKCWAWNWTMEVRSRVWRASDTRGRAYAHPSLRRLPTRLRCLAFANDTLVSKYPPEP